MHDRLQDELKRAISGLSDAEKLELIEELAHSLRPSVDGEGHATALQRQQAAFEQLHAALATAHPERDPYDHLGYADRAHDRILYDFEQK